MAEISIVDIIRSKRDGETLTAEQCDTLAARVTDHSVSDAQVGAFLMAAYCRGMSVSESAALTRAMAASGWQADWGSFDLDGPTVDKHSTGGLGDIISFLLAPMLAACGAYVPMISGRSLEHTGGTVDKLESIPGYNPFPEPARFQQVVAREGLALVGQTAQMVPADQRLYSVRDQTATVSSLPLIAASILSKKVAEGLQALVIDLKVGSGAFMRSPSDGEPLRDMLKGVAEACGLNCSVLFTDMDQPLACCVGDGLEMREALAYLRGDRRTDRLHRVNLQLGTELLMACGISTSADEARERLQRALESGAAAERFQRMVVALDGPTDLLDSPDRHLELGPVQRPVPAQHAGRVNGIDGRLLGHAVHDAARLPGQHRFDHRVGFAELVELGQDVVQGEPLAVVHGRDEPETEQLVDCVTRAVTLSTENS